MEMGLFFACCLGGHLPFDTALKCERQLNNTF